MKRILSQILIAILLCWQITSMAAVSVSIDPPAVSLGDTFRLTFTIDNPQGGGVPDLTPLQENFNIVGTERNMTYSMVNGQTQSSTQWVVLLIAKKTGVLPIPAIEIGHQQSTASHIEVTESRGALQMDDHQGIPQDDVMIKTEISQREAFINQQVIYTVKLYNNQRLLDAQYQPPGVEDALLIPLGDGRRYQTDINGRSYAVEEQQYAIFPQKSGKLTIVSPTFNALVFGAVPKRVNVQSKTRTLVIQPIPKDFKGKDWLPAKQVSLTEIYDKTDTKMKQGNTLIRTVTLQANGVPAQLLPEVTFPSSPQFNSYPEKPTPQNSAREQDVIGRTDVKVTYVLNKSGKITIPAVQISWFNTDTGKAEMASLPARTIEVEPERGLAPDETDKTTPIHTKTTSKVSQNDLPRTLSSENASGFAWWLAGGFALAWLITLILWVLSKRPGAHKQTKQAAVNALKNACKNNDAKLAQSALLEWAKVQWPGSDVLNLHQIAKLVHDTSLKKQLSLLSQAIYSEEKAIEWQGAALWRSISAYRRIKPTVKSNPSSLPPMNP